MNDIFNNLESIRESRGCVSLALIDPDSKNDKSLDKITDIIANSDFDAVLLGGSLIMDDKFKIRAKKISKNIDKPIILFPGSSTQITKYAEAILYISLLSGRNPQYLIGEHVQSAPKIYSLKMETIPTGYILLNGENVSSVQAISQTMPLPTDKFEIIAAHALAGQYLGMKAIYLEKGSGSKNTVNPKLIKYLYDRIKIPLIIGGGIFNNDIVKKIVNAGAGYVVIGTAIENSHSKNKLTEINRIIHGK